MVLAFVHTPGEFGVVLMVGGSISDETRTIAICDRVQAFDVQSADGMAVMDAGTVLQHRFPGAIHRAPRNGRVADLVGSRSRFHGRSVGPADQLGHGLGRWTTDAGAEGPLLEVRDKGRVRPGQAVTWVVPGDVVALLDEPTQIGDGPAHDIAAVVTEARQLGEITLATLALDAVPGAALAQTLSGPQRRRVRVGQCVELRLNLELVHMAPIHQR